MRGELMLVGVRPLTHIIRRMLASFYLILYFRLLQMFLRCDMSFQLRREDVLAIGLFNALSLVTCLDDSTFKHACTDPVTSSIDFDHRSKTCHTRASLIKVNLLLLL